MSLGKTGENYSFVAIIVNFGLLKASQYFSEVFISEMVQENYSSSKIQGKFEGVDRKRL